MYGVLLTTVFVISTVPLVVYTNPTTQQGVESWRSGWRALTPASLGVHTRIPLTYTTEIPRAVGRMSKMGNVDVDVNDNAIEESRGKQNSKYFKKYRRYMLPLLLAYKLKFFTLIPVFIGGLVLLTGATGLAGFFFALFAATMGLKGGGEH